MASDDGVSLPRKGLELDAPEPGDIVTVRVRPPTARQPAYAGRDPFGLGSLGIAREYPEHEAPQHYRVNEVWKVLAVNGGQAVVKGLTGYDAGRTEVWSIGAHRWFEASALALALLRGKVEKAEADLEMGEARGAAESFLREKRLELDRMRRMLAEVGEE